jgi:hypothetical protein
MARLVVWPDFAMTLKELSPTLGEIRSTHARRGHEVTTAVRTCIVREADPRCVLAGGGSANAAPS